MNTKKAIIAGAAILSGMAAYEVFFRERYFIKINKYSIGNLKAKRCIKIAQLSDLHLADDTTLSDNIIETVNNISPNVIVFTGDAIGENGSIEALRLFLSKLSKDIPKYAITGNWEYNMNIDISRLNKIYREANCKLLLNESSLLICQGAHLYFAGIDNCQYHKANLSLALAKIDKSLPLIFLIHEPGFFHTIDKYLNRHKDIKTAVVLAGHTHGGQMALPGYTPVIPEASRKLVAGWYMGKNTNLFISKGIGTSTIPARLFANAEIPVFYYYY